MRGGHSAMIAKENIHNSYNGQILSKQRRDQRRAQAFRTRQEITRVTTMLDVRGNKRVIRQQGKLGLAEHVSSYQPAGAYMRRIYIELL